MIAKAGLGLIGLSAISVGGVALAKPHLLGMDYMPKWHSLSEDNGFNTSSYSGKFSEKHTKYLVGVTNKNGKAEETNKAWWEWSFRRLSREKTKSDKFDKVTDGYGSNSTTDLNKVCEAAYKEQKSNVDDAGGEGKFKKSDVWKYCSPGGLLTHTDKDKDLYSGKIGGETDNKSKLISVKDSSNDWFWEIRNDDFWKEDNDWSGKNASGSDSNNSIFKTEYETNKGADKKDSRKTIKDLCEGAYGEEKNSKNSNNNTDALKFCVLEAPNS